jgi:hypothetical protein
VFGQLFGRPSLSVDSTERNLRVMTGQARLAMATLEMDTRAASPSGALRSAFGPPLEFSGWAELAAVIEEWRARAAAQDPASKGATHDDM